MLTLSGDQFLYDGQPYRILSGTMHYFRVVPEYWRDRLEKMRAFGLNTVETYVAWNRHEARPGKFDFTGMLDIEKFIRTAAEVGLNVIVRPGPYICSEWEFGGLPYWLLKDPNLKLRCAYPPYLAAVDRFFDALMPRLVPLLASNGGPIIAMQIENEYGSYGADKVYLQHLRDGMRARGIDVLFFTSDGYSDGNLLGGTLPDVFATVNLAYDSAEAFAQLRKYRPEGPLMVTEFWSGWFDHWGEKHHIALDTSNSIERSVQSLDEILAAGSSVNFYMFHGGTNFGFMNGANIDMTVYHPQVTSYDYAAPLDESGNPSQCFAAYREVLKKYVALPAAAELAALPRRAYGKVEMTGRAGLFDSLDVLSTKHACVTPDPMETFDQDYGFILYRTRITGPRPECLCQARGLHDRALVFVDGQFHSIMERETGDEYTSFEIPPEGVTLELLVENMGRVNFGSELLDRKGITDGVTFGGQYQFGWEIYPLPLDELSRLAFEPLDATPQTKPAFYRAIFTVDTPADTFLALPGWIKGVAWINGFNLGRYWDRGPQKTLYVPAPLLKQGVNELIVFELHGAGEFSVEFRDAPDLG